MSRMAAPIQNVDNPILYKCPYCPTGRFTKDDGWLGAVRHIRERHTEKKRRRPAILRRREGAEAPIGAEAGSLFDATP